MKPPSISSSLVGIALIDGGLEVRRLSTGAVAWRLRLADRAYQTKFDGAGRLWVLGS